MPLSRLSATQLVTRYPGKNQKKTAAVDRCRWASGEQPIRSNPRWRIVLWRAAVVGLIAVAIFAFIPTVALTVSIDFNLPEHPVSREDRVLDASRGDLHHSSDANHLTLSF